MVSVSPFSTALISSGSLFLASATLTFISLNDSYLIWLCQFQRTGIGTSVAIAQTLAKVCSRLGMGRASSFQFEIFCNPLDENKRDALRCNGMRLDHISLRRPLLT